MSDSGHSPLNMDQQQQLQQHVSPDRWNEEALTLLKCTELTVGSSKDLEHEIESSPLCSTIYKTLNELFNEQENKRNEILEIVGNCSGLGIVGNCASMERLDDLLEQENIIASLDEDMTNCIIPDYDELPPNVLEEYKVRISRIRMVYDSEFQKLQSLCDEYEKGMVGVFTEQPRCIPISKEKINSIIRSSRDRTQCIFQELKTNVDEAVQHVKKNMFESRSSKRKRRNFSKQATEILNEYFYSHIDNPYPSEETKADLAIQCNINLGQVSNWFGNKRIRYKRNIGKENSEDFDMDQKFSPPCDSGDNMLDDTNLEGISTSEDDDD